MEEIIRKYFACWLNKDEKPLTDPTVVPRLEPKRNRTEMGCQTNLHQPEHSNYRMVFPV